MIKPHGGKLVERIVGDSYKSRIMEQESEYEKVTITADSYKDLKNIAYGVFSPLEGFLNENDFISVLENSRLENDVPWTIPIVFDVDEAFTQRVDVGTDVLLVSKNGKGEDVIVGIFKIDEFYKYDKKKYVMSVFRTDDIEHPGVKKVMNKKDYLAGGKVMLVNEITSELSSYNLKPKETRYLFHKKGWKSVVAFQTRNPPHLGHEYVQKSSLTICDGLLINPVIGKKKPGDFLDKIIIEAYEALIKYYYPENRVVLSTFETEMHYAGPKEAIHHAIARKNLGCTHFIVGRDHAGVGNYYGPFDAHKIFNNFPDLGIQPICFRTFYKCKKCNAVVSDKICPHENSEYQVNFKGREVRRLLSEGKIPKEEMRPEVAEAIIKNKELFVK
ncbi:MAG: sulfate adenylyltransferase [Promethearchaeota archaeon]